MAIEELYAIAAEMRYQGRQGIRNETAKQLRRGKTAIGQAVKTNLILVLPHRGGLGAWASEGKFYMPVSVGTRVVGRARYSRPGHDMQGLDDGLVIHPYYNNPRMPWYKQGVPPNSISDPIREEGGHWLELAGVIAIEEAAVSIARA